MEFVLRDVVRKVIEDPGPFHAVLIEEDYEQIERAEYGMVKLHPGFYSIEWRKKFTVSFSVDPSMTAAYTRRTPEIELQAGHTYRLGADRTTGQGYSVFLWIEDVATGRLLYGSRKDSRSVNLERPAGEVYRAYSGSDLPDTSLAILDLGDADWVRVHSATSGSPPDSADADYVVAIEVTTAPDNSNGMGRWLSFFASALTLGIWPLYLPHDLVLTAEVTSRANQEPRTYRVEGKITEVWQTPLTVLLPLGATLPPERALRKELEPMVRVLFEKMRTDNSIRAPVE
jgi:hypothetical protein